MLIAKKNSARVIYVLQNYKKTCLELCEVFRNASSRKTGPHCVCVCACVRERESRDYRWRAGIAQSIATGYGLGDQGVGVRVPVGARIFTSPCRSDRLLGPFSLLSKRHNSTPYVFNVHFIILPSISRSSK
jgi:hypothetical protein